MNFYKNWFYTSCTILLTLSVGIAQAQSDIGECGIEPTTDIADTGDVLFQLDGKGYREADLPMPIQQAMFDARLKFYKEQLKVHA